MTTFMVDLFECLYHVYTVQAIANWQQNNLLLFDNILVVHIENCFAFAPFDWTRLCQPKRTIDKIKRNAQSSLFKRAKHTSTVLCEPLFILIPSFHVARPWACLLCINLHYYTQEYLKSIFNDAPIYTIHALYGDCNVFIKNRITHNACLMLNATTETEGKKRTTHHLFITNVWMPKALNWTEMILQWWFTLSTNLCTVTHQN